MPTFPTPHQFEAIGHNVLIDPRGTAFVTFDVEVGGQQRCYAFSMSQSDLQSLGLAIASKLKAGRSPAGGGKASP